MEPRIRAFRGATTVDVDEPVEIRAAIKALIDEMIDINALVDGDLVDCIVTATPDLTSMFAGTAVREECGFDDVPLLGAVEAAVDGALARCLRVMLHAYSPLARSDVRAVYHGQAKRLRPDLGPGQSLDPSPDR